ncbi:MAG: hypothetical protein QW632_03775 [Ignisphaera sp.]
MKILIENATILTMNSQKPFVQNGYLFIDKGVIVTYGEGAPPIELEFADYVINDSFAVVLPGFVVGMGNILHYLFQFNDNSDDLSNAISTLTRLELETLLEVSFASLAFHGVTSVVTLIREANEKIVQALAEASSNSWTRARFVLPASLISTVDDYEHLKKTLLKGVKDQDAMAKKMISMALLLESEGDLAKLSKEFIDVVNEDRTYVYVDSEVFEKALPIVREINNVILLNPKSYVASPCIYTSIDSWRAGCGIMSYETGFLNPKRSLSILYSVCKDAYTTVSALSHTNSLNNKIGTSSIRESEQADIIVLSFREPPYGPLPISSKTVVHAISNAFYTVKTVIVGGEIVLDNGLHLFVGEEKIKRAGTIINELSKKMLEISK